MHGPTGNYNSKKYPSGFIRVLSKYSVERMVLACQVAHALEPIDHVGEEEGHHIVQNEELKFQVS